MGEDMPIVPINQSLVPAFAPLAASALADVSSLDVGVAARAVPPMDDSGPYVLLPIIWCTNARDNHGREAGFSFLIAECVTFSDTWPEQQHSCSHLISLPLIQGT